MPSKMSEERQQRYISISLSLMRQLDNQGCCFKMFAVNITWKWKYLRSMGEINYSINSAGETDWLFG